MGRGPAGTKTASSDKGGRDPDKSSNKKEQRRLSAQKRDRTKELRRDVTQAETEMARLTERRTAIDKALFKPADAPDEFKNTPTSDLMKIRAGLERDLSSAEARWLKAGEALEQADAQ